jgi:hypothetical protein
MYGFCGDEVFGIPRRGMERYMRGNSMHIWGE